MKKVILGALVGGFVYFVWSTFYWAISGIPVAHAKTFADEAAVEKLLTEQAKEGPGYYILPTPKMPAGMAGDAAKKFGEDRMNNVATKFFFAGAIRPGGVGGLGAQIGWSLAFNILTALFLTLLVVRGEPPTPDRSFWHRWRTVLLAIAAGTTGIYVMMGVWWGVGHPWLTCLIIDWIIGWSFAGLAIAKLTEP